jgi:hypothetical protein
MPVYCNKCGVPIGSQAYITYGDEHEHIDYGDLKPTDEYGGEYDGEYYCVDCIDEAVFAEEEYEEVCE